MLLIFSYRSDHRGAHKPPKYRGFLKRNVRSRAGAAQLLFCPTAAGRVTGRVDALATLERRNVVEAG